MDSVALAPYPAPTLCLSNSVCNASTNCCKYLSTCAAVGWGVFGIGMGLPTTTVNGMRRGMGVHHCPHITIGRNPMRRATADHHERGRIRGGSTNGRQNPNRAVWPNEKHGTWEGGGGNVCGLSSSSSRCTLVHYIQFAFKQCHLTHTKSTPSSRAMRTNPVRLVKYATSCPYKRTAPPQCLAVPPPLSFPPPHSIRNGCM